MPSKLQKYIVSPEDFIDSLQQLPAREWWKLVLVLLGGIVSFLFYMWIYVQVLGLDLPKTAILKRRNMDWRARVERLSTHMDHQEELLSLLEVRDDKIYRSVYGLDEIPPEVRGSGIGGENRYEKLAGTSLEAVVRRQDIIEKRAYVQSKSFDDITILQNSAGDMAAHIPAIPPMSTDRNTYHMSSPFGFRSDPLLGYTKRHTGMDFACPPGNPIYATGDGVVVKVAHERKGYGNHVEIDHGFGYKTRYAHLSRIDVAKGMKVLRGDQIGAVGRTGKATGPHLHYEVLYKGNAINPYSFMNLDMTVEEYIAMITRRREESGPKTKSTLELLKGHGR